MIVVMVMVVIMVMMMAMVVMMLIFSMKHPYAENIYRKPKNCDKNGFIKSDGYRMNETLNRLDHHINRSATQK